MTKDQMALAAIVLMFAGIVAGFMSYASIAWILVIIGIALVIYAKLKG